MKETSFDFSGMEKKGILAKLNSILRTLPLLPDADKRLWKRMKYTVGDMRLLKKYPIHKRIEIKIDSTWFSILPFKEPFTFFCKRMKSLKV